MKIETLMENGLNFKMNSKYESLYEFNLLYNNFTFKK